MLLLHPRLVRFGPASWDHITAVAIDRSAHRTVEDWTDLGPYAAHADVPEQSVRIRITQELEEGDPGSPRPGEQATLTLCTAPTLGDAGRRRLTATAVILDVAHDLALKRGALRVITLAAISPDGSTDPIQITDATDGQA